MTDLVDVTDVISVNDVTTVNVESKLIYVRVVNVRVMWFVWHAIVMVNVTVVIYVTNVAALIDMTDEDDVTEGLMCWCDCWDWCN